MDVEQFMPDAETVAAIEKDVATYNKRRAYEQARLGMRRPAVFTAYAVTALVLAYAIYRAAEGFHWLHGALVGGGVGLLPHIDKWVKKDAAWAQQRFRDHMLPVMFGFIPDFRYRHGVTPRAFERMPREMVPGHNQRTFDDVLTGTLEGGSFELSEMKLAQRSKNSETVLFQGAVLHCRLRTPFAGTLVATRRIGDFRRFFRDLFDRSGLTEIVSGDRRLDELYEFRTSRRTEARRLLAGPLGGMLSALWREWPGDTAQVGIRGEDVVVMLPTSRNFFELPSIETDVSYAADLAPMMRQIARFLSIAAMVPALDGVPPAEQAAPPEAVPEQASEPEAAPAATMPRTQDGEFVPLLDPVAPAEAAKRPGQGRQRKED